MDTSSSTSGLAGTMVYGTGADQNTKHYYAGNVNKPKKKKNTKSKNKSKYYKS